MLRVAAVSYLNTLPFIFGLQQSPLQFELQLHYPSRLLDIFKNNECDIALLPIAALKLIPDAQVITNYCIGCNGAVASVILAGNCNMDDAQSILLDYQSTTSIQLTQLLIRDYFKLNKKFEPALPGYELQFDKNKSLALIIGDRALQLKNQFSLIYDLGELWKLHTRLPFAFAVWVCKPGLDDKMINAFNNALAFGVYNIKAAIASSKQYEIDEAEATHYLTANINYHLDENKRKAISLFLKSI
ncbi:MAG: menaquinone biosynthesis protein [Bacteroidetes bacterium]|nr:menaquinone biosynthesis protein [Bacteroidota bacterium]